MSPRGPIMIDPETRDIVQTIYVRKVEKQGRRALERRVRQVREREGPGQAAVTARGQPSVTSLLGVLFDGIAYGSLLFVISIGLSVTMGLMNFINLAHGAFAMIGGYVCVVAMTRLGVPFLATLPLAFIVSALVGRRPRTHALPAPLQSARTSTR